MSLKKEWLALKKRWKRRRKKTGEKTHTRWYKWRCNYFTQRTNRAMNTLHVSGLKQNTIQCIQTIQWLLASNGNKPRHSSLVPAFSVQCYIHSHPMSIHFHRFQSSFHLFSICFHLTFAKRLCRRCFWFFSLHFSPLSFQQFFPLLYRFIFWKKFVLVVAVISLFYNKFSS